jgi:hypothetical protein
MSNKQRELLNSHQKHMLTDTTVTWQNEMTLTTLQNDKSDNHNFVFIRLF